MTEHPVPLAAVFAPQWDDEDQRWLCNAVIRLPWMERPKILVTAVAGVVERPARESVVNACVLRMLAEANDYIRHQTPFVPGCGDIEYTEVTGLLDPDEPDRLTEGSE